MRATIRTNRARLICKTNIETSSHTYRYTIGWKVVMDAFKVLDEDDRHAIAHRDHEYQHESINLLGGDATVDMLIIVSGAP